MESIAVLESRQHGQCLISYYWGEIKTIASEAKVDAYIVATENGFSPLGSNLRFLATELGVPEKEIARLADWNRFDNPRVSLVVLPSIRESSYLRGLVLAPSETSECYRPFAARCFGRPYRDFYYNVTYESIAYASQSFGARHLAISHLSWCNTFHEDIATCNAEALAHYCDTSEKPVESFTFLSDTEIRLEHLAGLRRLNHESETGQHRPISTEIERREGYDLVHLDLNFDSLQ